MQNRKIDMLQEIGLKELEAKIYLILLKEPNITAYRVAKILKKPKTTVYKALEIMEKEGLIRGNKAHQPLTYSTVKISEYLDEQEKKLQKNRKKLETELNDIEEIPANTGIYEITRLHQVFSKAIELIENARHKIIITCVVIRSPELIKAIERAADSGVKLMVDCAERFSNNQKIRFISSRNNNLFISKIQYNWIEIFVDGNQYLTALLSKDDRSLFKAQWCNDPYTSILTYNANSRSLILAKVNQMLEQKKTHSEVLEFCRKTSEEFYEPVSMEVIKHLIGD